MIVFNMKLYLVFFIGFVGIDAFSQIKILDSSTKQEILFVHVLDQSSNYITSSNVNGIIDASEITHLSVNDSIAFYHISYKPTTIKVEDLRTKDKVFLEVKDHHLEEVVVKARKGKKGYLKISAAFRGYQFYDGSLKYYSDGYAEYLGNLRNQKYKNRLHSYRFYEDEQMLNEEKGHDINWTKVGVSRLKNNYLPSEIFTDRPIAVDINDSLQLIVIAKDTIGKLTKRQGHFVLEIQDFFSKKKISLFGNTSVLLYNYITLIFKDVGQEFFDINTYENLLYYKTTRHHDFYRKDEDQPISILHMEEVFVDRVQYYPHKREIKNYDEFRKYHSLNEPGDYSNANEYISRSRFYYPLSSSILQKTGFK